MKVIVLVNPAAGSVGPRGMDQMKEALARAGLEDASLMNFDPDTAVAQIQSLIEEAPDLLIVWGGDGTHRTALNVAGLRFAGLLLLPGGTMNLLTRWLHGDAPWHVILQAALLGRTTRVLDAGRVGEQLFFCALLAGAPARFAQVREDFRMGQLGRALKDAGAAVETAQHLHLQAQAGPDTPLLPGNVFAALVGPLSQSSRMDVAGLSLPSAGAALSLVWTAVRSDWHRFQGLVLHAADAVTITDPEGKPIPAIMDGEQIEVGARFTVHYQPAAARCLIATGRSAPGSG